MAIILSITASAEAPLPSLEILGHDVHKIDFDPSQLAAAPRHDITLLDCRVDLLAARSMAKILAASGWATPILLVVTEQNLPAINSDWGHSDFLLESAGLSEIDLRLRLLIDAKITRTLGVAKTSGLSIDEVSYTAKVNGRTLDLTFKEFELLRHLNDNPGRVFSREQLLSEVWGYDYFGGTRTVDVHVRRLRAKLGEYESLIGTVRNVGYRLNPDGHQEE